MPESFSKELKYFPKIALVCEHNPLSLEIIKLLLENNCNVDVLSKEKSIWNDAKKYGRVGDVLIQNPDEYVQGNNYLNYVLCLGIMGKQSNPRETYDNIVRLSINLAKRNSCKVLFIFNSFCDEDDFRGMNYLKALIRGDNNLYAGIILLADYVFISNFNINPPEIYSNFLKTDLKKKVLYLERREKYYILDPENIAGKIIESLFSLRVYGNTVGFYSRETKADLFERDLLARIGGLKIDYGKRCIELTTKEKVYMNSGNKKAIENIYQFFKSTKNKKTTRNFSYLFKKSKPPNKSHSIKTAKKRVFFKLAFFILTCFFLLPYVLSVICASLFFIGKFFYFKLDPSQTSLFFKLSNNIISINQKYLYSTSQVPFVGKLFLTISSPNKVLKEANTLAVEGLEISIKGTTLIKTISLSGKFDKEALNLLYLDLENFYNQLGFFEAESKSGVWEAKLASKLLLGKLKLEELKKVILGARDLARVLPEIVGENKPTQYMILFQKDSIPRPTGGIIEKIAIISFSDGEVIDFENLEVDSIDNNLYGQVDSPASLKKYFGKKSMGFKEVNWDPDFFTSANKAEWFLDKALDKSVDGVVAINMDFLEKFNNIQETLLRNNFKLNKSLEFLFLLSSALGNKDLQLFVNNNQTNAALLKLKSGTDPGDYKCSSNCYSDTLGLYEFVHEKSQAENIERKASLTISLEEKLIKRKLTYYLNNTSNPVYKGILRIFVPGDAGFGIISRNQNNKKLEGDLIIQGIRGFKVADVYFEVNDQSPTVISLSWESGTGLDFTREGWYSVDWNKQSGIEPFPISLRIEKGKGINLFATPAFTLTDGDFLGYNTDLSRDYFSRIFWSNKNE